VLCAGNNDETFIAVPLTMSLLCHISDVHCYFVHMLHITHPLIANYSRVLTVSVLIVNISAIKS